MNWLQSGTRGNEGKRKGRKRKGNGKEGKDGERTGSDVVPFVVTQDIHSGRVCVPGTTNERIVTSLK